MVKLCYVEKCISKPNVLKPKLEGNKYDPNSKSDGMEKLSRLVGKNASDKRNGNNGRVDTPGRHRDPALGQELCLLIKISKGRKN